MRKNIIFELALKILKSNRRRNLIVISSVILTAILFTSFFTIGSGLLHGLQLQTMKQVGNLAHVTLKYIPKDIFNAVKDDNRIKEIGYQLIISNEINNHELRKNKVLMVFMDETCQNLNFCQPISGEIPKVKNEIMLDTQTLDKLGVPHRLGEKVNISYRIKDKEFNEEFLLSAFYEKSTVGDLNYLFISEAFVNEKSVFLNYTYDTDYDYSGVSSAYILFKKNNKIEAQTNMLLYEKDLNHVEYSLNWAYVGNGANIGSSTFLAVILTCLLFFLTGNLIIHNVFQISYTSDIKFNGLLKTLGATSKQLKKIFYLQTLILALISIPLGLGMGYLIGVKLFPLILKMMNISITGVPLNPLIFIIAGLFTFLTLFFSIRKPSKIAAELSPIQSANYVGKINYRGVKRGSKLYLMALANLLRNKRKAIIIVVSISLSIIIFNSVYLLSGCFDLDKYLGKYVDTDYLVANADYFKSNFFQEQNSLEPEIIEIIEKQEGFEKGGSIYFNLIFDNCRMISPLVTPDDFEFHYTDYVINLFDLYGVDDFVLERFECYKGKIDKEKLNSGKYILYGLDLDDNGNVLDDGFFSCGDKICVSIEGKKYEYEILAIIEKNNNNTVRYKSKPFSFYMPYQEYSKVIKNPIRMSYLFNIEDDYEEEFEVFLNNYSKQTGPDINYSSKKSYISEFKETQQMISVVGGILAIICGVIGLLNYINSIVTGLLDRKQELLLMRKIGMTVKQQKIMLIFEGTYYALATFIFSFIFSILFSEIILRSLLNLTWFGTYRLDVLPVILILPLVLFFALIIPLLTSKKIIGAESIALH